MIESLFTDKVKIVTVSQDKYGVITETESAEIECKIEDENRLILDKNGKEVISNILVFLPKNVTINYEDKIIITKKNEVSYPMPNKKWQIKKFSLVGGWGQSHYEIYC